MDDRHNHQVSHISLVPAMLAQLLDLAQQPPRSLQVVRVFTGGLGAGSGLHAA